MWVVQLHNVIATLIRHGCDVVLLLLILLLVVVMFVFSSNKDGGSHSIATAATVLQHIVMTMIGCLPV